MARRKFGSILGVILVFMITTIVFTKVAVLVGLMVTIWMVHQL